jgi:hypothetical protein
MSGRIPTYASYCTLHACRFFHWDAGLPHGAKLAAYAVSKGWGRVSGSGDPVKPPGPAGVRRTYKVLAFMTARIPQPHLQAGVFYGGQNMPRDLSPSWTSLTEHP